MSPAAMARVVVLKAAARRGRKAAVLANVVRSIMAEVLKMVATRCRWVYKSSMDAGRRRKRRLGGGGGGRPVIGGELP